MCEAAAYLQAGDEAAMLRERLAHISTRYVVIGYGIAMFGSINRPLGQLALAEERWTDAVSLLESAIEENVLIELEPYVAHSRRELSMALLRRDAPGDRRHARRLLEQAHAAAERLGMAWLLRQARQWPDERGYSHPPNSGLHGHDLYRDDGAHGAENAPTRDLREICANLLPHPRTCSRICVVHHVENSPSR